MVNDGLKAAEEKMRREGVPDAAIATFRHYYEQLVAGEAGLLPRPPPAPVEGIPPAGGAPRGARGGAGAAAPHVPPLLRAARGGRVGHAARLRARADRGDPRGGRAPRRG